MSNDKPMTHAQQTLKLALERATGAGEKLNDEYNTLSEMHSQLVRLNMERRATINALANMAENLFSIALPFQSDGDSVWRAMVKEYQEAMKLAGRGPKIEGIDE